MFNLGGFRDHVRLIVGPASETYRDFEPTAGRTPRAAVADRGYHRARRGDGRCSWSSAAGIVLALLTPRHRRTAIWLALPAVSYYVGFVNVVLYNYDRFMLPVCLILALFGGLAVDRWLAAESGPGRSGRPRPRPSLRTARSARRPSTS